MNSLINVFLTEDRVFPLAPPGFPAGQRRYIRGHLPNSDKLDIFKYMMLSMKPIRHIFDKFYILCELDTSYAHRQAELDDFLAEHFPDAVYLKKRLCYQKDWIEFLDTRLDEVEHWFVNCNHDHIFLDSSLAGIYNVIAEFEQDTSEFKCIYPTHWPEVIFEAIKYSAVPLGQHTSYHAGMIGDGTLFVNSSVIKHWFYSKQYPQDRKMPRPDFDGGGVDCAHGKVFAPLRELFRHFDGYAHSYNSVGLCPALHIPNGFFEGSMDIYYGYDGTDGVQIHPGRPAKDVYPDGADFHGLLSDIPMFWRDRIRSIQTHNRVYDGDMLILRNNVYKNLMSSCATQRGLHTPPDYYKCIEEQ